MGKYIHWRWTETSLERIKEIGITKEQVEKICDKIYLGPNIVTKVLWTTKQMELINKINRHESTNKRRD